jgi:LuxR family maltose regulon positive regulatory protein
LHSIERMWFRYHHLFADLLALELRRRAPEEIGRPHLAASPWLHEHGSFLEATRHAPAGEDWPLTARLLVDHLLRLELDWRQATVRELLTRLAGPTRH